MAAPALNSDRNKPSTQSKKQQLESIWKASGKKPQELEDHPEEPPHFPWVWEWFHDMPSPVTWSEVWAWSECSGIQPARWEGELLIRLDYLRK